MANINNKVKDIHTNTFYVNPTQYEGGQVTKDADVMGVRFNEATYKDGIEVPDKFVTVNGATNYHILDAVNLYWDDVRIPWAQKITKWKDAIAYSMDPNYEYNKPSDESSWANDGIIRESEDVADILNYLIYRTVSIDYILDQMNSVGLQTPALRLVNNRTDWYAGGNGITPDDFDGDTASRFFDTISDNRFTVKPAGLKVYLYPYLMSSYWEGPDSEDAPINISERVPLYDSTGTLKPGIVLSDTGWDVQRQIMWNGQGKIREGEDNFDIFQIETISTSKDIRFVSSKKKVLDSFVNMNLEITETDGFLNENTTVTCWGYKLPVVAYKCINTEEYPYTTLDLLSTLVKYNYPGLNGTNNEHYRQLIHSSFTPAIDPTYTNVTFGIEIAKVPSTVDVPEPVVGYKGDSKIFNAIVYKGDNTLYDLKLEGKSKTYENLNDEIVKQTFLDSRGNPVDVYGYLTCLPITPTEEDYTNEDVLHLFKSKIVFKAEFSPEYDALPENNGSDENNLKKSHVHPYFIAKPDTVVDPSDVINSINVEAYKTINSESFDKNPEVPETYILYDNPKYGRITYEKTTVGEDSSWDYYYWAPILTNLDDPENVDTIYIRLYALMYYPIDDVKTNRLLNPLYAELPITLKRIVPNKFNTIHGIEVNESNYVADCVSFESTADYSTINEDGNLVIDLCKICKTKEGSTDFSCEVVGYALEDYTTRNIDPEAEPERLWKTQVGISWIYDDQTEFPIKTEDNFITIEKDEDKNYRKTVPASQFWTFDGTKIVEVDEIPIAEGDDKLVDIVEGTNPDTGDKFVNVIIKNSTALYPKANGLLANEGSLNTFVDSDKDYFYIVLKIKCARNFDNYRPQENPEDNVIYDECETYYALKVQRADLSFSKFTDISSTTVRENLYLQTLLNTDDLEIFNQYTGEYKWGINDDDISIAELEDESTVKLVNSIVVDNIYFYNIGDTWPWRHKFLDISKSGISTNEKIEKANEEVKGEIQIINYTTNIGLFKTQREYLIGTYGDEKGYGTLSIMPYGETAITFSDQEKIESYGPILYVDRLKTVANRRVVFFSEDTVKISFELCMGNDPRHNLTIKRFTDFTIKKKDSDIIPISRMNGGLVVEGKYYSFVDDPDNILELNVVSEAMTTTLEGNFCFVETSTGDYYYGLDEQSNPNRRNINTNGDPIIMNGDTVVGSDGTSENTFKYLMDKRFLTPTITLNGSPLRYSIRQNPSEGIVTVSFDERRLNPDIDSNLLRIEYEGVSDIYKRTTVEMKYKKTIRVPNS